MFPNEGKSTVSVHLWKLLAEAGFPTVLVDVDLRKSEHNTILKMQGVEEGIIIISPEWRNMRMLFMKQIFRMDIGFRLQELLENPSALLEDPRLEELLNRLSEDYRYVIIDTPPLDNISDGALIASMSDGAVLVVRCAETPKNIVKQSLQQIDRVGMSSSLVCMTVQR